jgi:hypothetical protein
VSQFWKWLVDLVRGAFGAAERVRADAAQASLPEGEALSARTLDAATAVEALGRISPHVEPPRPPAASASPRPSTPPPPPVDPRPEEPNHGGDPMLTPHPRLPN